MTTENILVRTIAFLLGSWTAVGCSDESLSSNDVAAAHQPIIFGTDDRQEPGPWLSAEQALLVRASVALVPATRLDSTHPPVVQIATQSLQSRFGVCADERFANQPAIADCGGTLIRPDAVLTAGHCLASMTCAQTKVVFDYAIAQADEIAPIPIQNVYSCAEVVVQRLDATYDYAIVRLDRAVSDRVPAPMQLGALPLQVGTPLFTVGYPSGLPQKVSTNAVVNDSRRDTLDYFTAHLDSLPGNSGGGVFGLDSNTLVGVLVRGAGRGYIEQPGERCARPEQVADSSDLQVESVYVAPAIDHYCRVANDPDFCICGNGICEPQLQETTASCPRDCGSRCGDGACNGDETGDTCYADCGRCGNLVCEAQEVARLDCCDDCGCPTGFSCESGRCQPQLGNVNGDASVDAQDLFLLKAELIGWHQMPYHAAAADVDCSGSSDWDDVRALAQLVTGKEVTLPCYRVESLALGESHACVAMGSGHVRCWGANSFGELGLGSTTRAELGARNGPDLSLDANVNQIVASRSHTCALSRQGKVKCWGRADYGQLGYGSTASVGATNLPSDVGSVELSAAAAQIAAGGMSTCAVLTDGRVQCWGDNTFGQLGYGHLLNIGDDETPASQAPISFGQPMAEIAVGEVHVCGRTTGGEVYCWGSNMLGQLGTGGPDSLGDDEPANVASPVVLGEPAKAIAVGSLHSCALLQSGKVRCWGDNTFGQLGNVDLLPVGDDETPDATEPLTLGDGVVEIAVGDMHCCARYADGNVRCWGDNALGQLGLATTEPISLWTQPADVPFVQIGGPAVGLVSKFNQTCVRLASGALRCWGANDKGQLGYPGTDPIGDNETPQSAGDVPVTGINSIGWSFVNSQNLDVWLQDERTDSSGTSLALYVGGTTQRPASAMAAFMLFDSSEAAGQDMRLDVATANHSRIFLEQEPERNVALLRFEFPDETPAKGNALRCNKAERFRLSYASSNASWVAANDYAVVDQWYPDLWYRSQRVQIVDARGGVIYGWRRDGGK